MLNSNPFIETATIAPEIAGMHQLREELQIRSLLEHPALRLAMGLDAPAVIETTVVEPAPARDLAAAVSELVAGAAGATARKRQPKRTPKVAAAPRTNKGTAVRSTARTTSNQRPRFDRRALLEADRDA